METEVHQLPDGEELVLTRSSSPLYPAPPETDPRSASLHRRDVGGSDEALQSVAPTLVAPVAPSARQGTDSVASRDRNSSMDIRR